MRILSLIILLSIHLVCAPLTNGDKVQWPDTNKILTNPGIENGITGWTQNSGTLSRDTTTAADGVASLKFAAAGANNNFTSSVFNAPAGLANRSAVAVMKYKFADASAGNLSFQVYDSTNAAILANQQLSSTVGTNWTESQLNFVAPSAATNMQLRVTTAGAIAGNANFDSFGVYDASRVNISQVSQAEAYGALTWAGTTNCSWAVTANATFTAFSADNDCPTPTVEGKATAPATKIPAITLNNMPPGEYLFISSNYSYSGGGNVACAYQFHDGTTGFGYGASGITTSNIVNGQIIGRINYTTSGTRTISIQATGRGGNGTCTIENNASADERLIIAVYRFPTASETAYRADTSNQISSLTYAGATNCVWSNTGSSFASYSADSDCGTPTVTGKASAPGTKIPGIVLSSLTPGTYQVVATGTFLAYAGSAAPANCQFRFTDGTNNFGTGGAYGYGSSGQGSASTIMGYVTYTALQSNLTIQLQSGEFNSAGSPACQIHNAVTSESFRIDVIPVSQSFPMPQIVNSVTTTAQRTKVVSAEIANAGTPSITRQDGSWISSLTDSATGDTTINVAAGTFTVAPNCSVTIRGAAGYKTNIADTLSTTVVEVKTYDGSSNLADIPFSIICVGQY